MSLLDFLARRVAGTQSSLRFWQGPAFAGDYHAEELSVEFFVFDESIRNGAHRSAAAANDLKRVRFGAFIKRRFRPSRIDAFAKSLPRAVCGRRPTAHVTHAEQTNGSGVAGVIDRRVFMCQMRKRR